MSGEQAAVDERLQQSWLLRHEDARTALALAEAALAQAQRLDYAAGVARGVLRVALCRLVIADDDARCEAELERAVALMSALGDLRGEAEAINLLASVHSRRNEHDRAIERYMRCVELHRSAGDRAGEAGALNNLAVEMRATHRPADAMELLFASLAIAEADADDAGSAYALCNIGGVLADAGDPQAAIDHFERALAFVSRTRDRALECSVRIGLGRVFADLGRGPMALAQALQAVDLARRTGNRADLVEALTTLGGLQLRFASADDARAALDEALVLLAPMPDRRALSRTLCARARLHAAAGELDAARDCGDRALAAARAARHDAGVSEAHRMLAEVHERAGDSAAALDHFRRFYEAERRIDGHETRRRMRGVLVQAEVARARRHAASHEQQAIALARELGAERQARQEHEERVAELARRAETFEKLAHEDVATGLPNRRSIDRHLAEACTESRRSGSPLSLAMVDVDGCRRIADEHGSAAADAVLRQVAALLRAGRRPQDRVGNYGGDLFVLLLVDTGPERARRHCEALRASVEAFDWRVVHPGLHAVTVSIGVASAGDEADAPRLVADADRQRGRAKQLGRNRVCG